MFLFKTSRTYLKLYSVQNLFFGSILPIQARIHQYFEQDAGPDCLYFHLSVFIRFSKI